MVYVYEGEIVISVRWLTSSKQGFDNIMGWDWDYQITKDNKED